MGSNGLDLEALMNNPNIGITMINANGVLSFANDSFLTLLHDAKDSVVGVDAMDFFLSGKTSQSLFARSSQSRQPVTEDDYFYKNKEGAMYKLSLTHVPLFDKSGHLQFILGVNRNISLNRRSGFLLGNVHKHTYTNDNGFVYGSAETKKMLDMTAKVADYSTNILITGETGTGKDVLARYIHNIGSRKKGRFIAVNCAALPESLIESELFGYEKGTFTGSLSQGKAGLIEQANGGALFLDEINSLPLAMQSKLLVAVETRCIRRLGGAKEIPVDCCIISASNQDLAQQVEKGEFRRDLYYRLSIFETHIPPLRERKEDIKALISYFLEKYNKKYSKCVEFEDNYYNFLATLSWNGNVRELRNYIERVVLFSESDIVSKNICPILIPAFSKSTDRQLQVGIQSDSEPLQPLRVALNEYEKQILTSMMKKYGQQNTVAKLLDIPPSTLTRKLKNYGIT